MQIQFDPRWNIPSVAHVEEVAKERFRLSPSRHTSMAPAAKFMVLYFESLTDAQGARQDVPMRLITRQQWPSDAQCEATVLTMAEAGDAVSKAAAMRGRDRGDSAAKRRGGPPRPQYGQPAWPAGGAPAAAPAAPPAAPLYAVPLAGPPPPPPAPPPGYSIPPGAQPGTLLHAAPPPDVVPPVVPPFAPQPAVPVAVPGASTAGPQAAAPVAPPSVLDMNALSSILEQAGGESGESGAAGAAAAGAAPAAEADPSTRQILGLLTQLGPHPATGAP